MPLDYPCKVEVVPKSIIRETEFHFKAGLSAADVMQAMGEVRKVALSALYAEVLGRMVWKAVR